jgi:hypothetical protein
MASATQLTDSPARDPGAARASSPSTGCPSLLTPTAPATVPAVERSRQDLHLDEVITAMAPGDFQRGVWRRPVTEVAVIEYRQDVVDDLRNPAIRRAAESFEAAMASSRNSIAARRGAHYPIPAELNLLEAIGRFCGAVAGFAEALSDADPGSDGLSAVCAHLWAYQDNAGFRELAEGSAALLIELRTPAVELGMQGGTVWVDADSGRAAWADEIAGFFARFEAGDGATTAVPARPRRYLNHVEAQAIGLVAELRPEAFARLHRFAAGHEDFLPADLDRLGEELRFYLGFLKVADQLAGQGVEWCRPRVLAEAAGRLSVGGVVDLALALRSRPDDPPLVPNDLALGPRERIAFVTGPNQGGKTTFARAIAQLAYLASLGLPVPARAATLPLLNPVLTHFPQPDDPENQRGGLADEIARLHEVMQAATGSALLVLNELFSATSAEDALELSEVVVPEFTALGCRVLWVTFLEDLVASVDGASSLVGQVAADDPTKPTFRFRPQPPAGRSHAAALAARHGLSSEDLARRLA